MLKLRKACEQDCDLFFQWANDKECRKNSFSTEPIAYESHCQWFQKKLQSKTSELFLLEEEKPVGMLRLDYEDQQVKISYSIAAEQRGRGYGKKLLELAETFVKENRQETYLVAEVKKENMVSRHLFLLMGYVEVEQDKCMEYKKKISP
ncbi:MAG: GNAT family N-acetyltransferase [Lachnospiraceae bacterium]|nr:GNAT family N-acetyltransferase [Lachnospiraceae bacterium]